MDKIDELKPCPFCGGEARWVQVKTDVAIVFCAGCGATTAKHFDIRGCVESWNTRPIETALLARAEKAVAMVAKLIGAGHKVAILASLNTQEDDDLYSAWSNLVSEWEHRNDKPEEPK